MPNVRHLVRTQVARCRAAKLRNGALRLKSPVHARIRRWASRFRYASCTEVDAVKTPRNRCALPFAPREKVRSLPAARPPGGDIKRPLLWYTRRGRAVLQAKRWRQTCRSYEADIVIYRCSRMQHTKHLHDLCTEMISGSWPHTLLVRERRARSDASASRALRSVSHRESHIAFLA